MCFAINGQHISKTSIKQLCDWKNRNQTEQKLKKNKSLSVINLPVCREMILLVAFIKFIFVFQCSEQFHSFIVPVQVATELNSCVGNEQWNRTRSIVIIRMNICFFLRYQYDYCSKLHSHLFMPMSLD